MRLASYKGSIFSLIIQVIILISLVSEANKTADKTVFLWLFFSMNIGIINKFNLMSSSLYLHSYQNLMKYRNMQMIPCLTGIFSNIELILAF